MEGREFLNQLFAFGSQLQMTFAAVLLSRGAANQFSFDEPIHNVHGGMMFDLKTLAELRDGEVFSRKGFDCEKRFVLLGVKTGLGCQ